MILLAGEACRLYESLSEATSGKKINILVQQFFHHPWHGLHFWDLVQPAFMTMAGSAMYISYYYKRQKGISWQQNFRHILFRCLKLFIAGTALHCVYAGRLVWELWNVLTQLSVTTLIAYLIIQRSAFFQVCVSVLLLLLTEVLYRFVLMPGFDQPFIKDHNFGSWMDTVLMRKINRDGWVAINIIPTAAHTIWGAVAGKLIISNSSSANKIKSLIIAAAITLILGYSLEILNITPIIKRISTSSFVLTSGGWVLLMMAFLYWFTDVKQFNCYARIFTVIGMNSIFIYLFFETVGIQWVNQTIAVFVKGFTGFMRIDEGVQSVLSALVTLLVEWGLCYWLYKRKIFFKL